MSILFKNTLDIFRGIFKTLKMPISDFLVNKYNLLYFFVDSREKEFRVGTF